MWHYGRYLFIDLLSPAPLHPVISQRPFLPVIEGGCDGCGFYSLLAFLPHSLGPLVKKIKDSQIEVIINALCSNMFSTSERLRDISSVGLKTVISEFPRTTQAVATTASRNITGKMVDAISKPVSRWLEGLLWF